MISPFTYNHRSMKNPASAVGRRYRYHERPNWITFGL